MIYFPQIEALTLYGVNKRGIPNEEYIVFRVNSTVNIAQFGIMLGLSTENNELATPMNDYFFWMTDIQLDPATWLYIYTGSGQRKFTTTSTNEAAYIMYWGHSTVLFENPYVVPLIFQIGNIIVGDIGADAKLQLENQ